MKTPEEWVEIINQRGDTTQPAGTLRLVREIQEDANKDIEAENAALCAFINRELKATAADPRIAELLKSKA